MPTVVLRPFLLVLIAVTALAATDWPGWRGPERNGVAPPGPALVGRLPAEPTVTWQTRLLEGKDNTHASPAIADGRVFVHTATGIETQIDGKKHKTTLRVLAALALSDGTELWRHGTEGGKAHNTPCVAGSRVIYQDGGGNVLALAIDTGKELWRTAIGRSGTNASPAVVDELVVIPVGRDIHALGLADGVLRWKTPVSTMANSPMIWRHQGKAHVIVGNEQVTCLDLTSGEPLWTFQGTDRSKDPSSPAIHGDLMATMFEGGGLRVHRLSPTGVELVHTVAEFIPQGGGAHQASSPVFDGQRIYGVDGKKTFCYDLERKAVVWEGAKGDSHASPILADGKLIVLEKNKTLLFDAATGADLGSNAMAASYCSSFALSGTRLVANQGGVVTCYDLAPK